MLCVNENVINIENFMIFSSIMATQGVTGHWSGLMEMHFKWLKIA